MEWSVVLGPVRLSWHGMDGCLRPGKPEEDGSICERSLYFSRTVVIKEEDHALECRTVVEGQDYNQSEDQDRNNFL